MTHQVVIVGGGFGGLYAAQALRRAPVEITLIDKRNFHLFQPLLYQVATGGVSPGDIASPLRGVLSRQKNARVLLAEMTGIAPEQKEIVLKNGDALPYDTLIVAAGAEYHYFGNDQWAKIAPGLKTLEDALEMRRRIFLAFEAAEKESDPVKRQAWLTFVVVGGGPTGVELAGALGELAQSTLLRDFRQIDTRQTRILLLEGMERILLDYPAELSAQARRSLASLGVTVQTGRLLQAIEGDQLRIKIGDGEEIVQAKTVLWAAGVQASPLGRALADRLGVATDRMGRLIVEPDLTLPGYGDILVIGDLAHFAQESARPLPGVAPVAMQQGQYAAKLITNRLKGRDDSPPFRYWNKGNLAVIGRNAAVAEFGRFRFSGFLAWLIWLFVHLLYLIEFDNKVVVMFQWGWSYFTRRRGARLITGPWQRNED
jgi:NADH:ubiquinone reductase (H+-translocating)